MDLLAVGMEGCTLWGFGWPARPSPTAAPASAGARMGHARCHGATVYLGVSVVELCVHGTTLLVALLCGAML